MLLSIRRSDANALIIVVIRLIHCKNLNSSNILAPCPTPTHIVARLYCLRFISWTSVVESLTPLQPNDAPKQWRRCLHSLFNIHTQIVYAGQRLRCKGFIQFYQFILAIERLALSMLFAWLAPGRCPLWPDLHLPPPWLSLWPMVLNDIFYRLPASSMAAKTLCPKHCRP